MKTVVVHATYSCPDCGARAWPAGDDYRDIHHCLCDDGVWRWNGNVWVWVQDEVVEVGGIL